MTGELHRDTQLARGHLPPVDRSSVHEYVDAEPGPFYYQRSGHPVGAELERVLGKLEGGHALLFGSGSAATMALALALLGPGSRIAVAEGGYWGTMALLENELGRWGLEVVSFDQTAPPPPADLVWLEPCSNPMLSFPDLEEAIATAHGSGSKVVVDNTVLSPVMLRPLEYGADFVLHSATKILAGHHDVLLGAVISGDEADHSRLEAFRTASGFTAAPDVAWLALRGLKTLSVRAYRQSQTALELARRLAAHPAVECVRYPGLEDAVAARYLDAFGPLLSFDVADAQTAKAFERALRLVMNATSLGGVASTLEARARWEGDRVPPGLLRLSVGLEDVEDLWSDLTQALDSATAGA